LPLANTANALVDDGFGGQEARFSCNTSIQTAEEAYKLVNDLLSVMRCQAFWSIGSLTIAQDAPSDPVYLFNQANVTPEGFSYSGSSLKVQAQCGSGQLPRSEPKGHCLRGGRGH
jgi:predicted phage tail protein